MKCPKCGKKYVAKPTLDGQPSDTKKSRPSSNENPFPVLPAKFGRYRVLKLLGRGGMGAVFLAEDSQLGRQVALKIPFLDASDTQRMERFAREARSSAMLHHPNICTVFDAGQIDGRPFITMTYIAGTPLEQEIDPETPMPQIRAAELVRKIAVALEYAHNNGTVHRDLKPANIMMAENDEPVVMDFGLAKQVVEIDPKEVKLTRDGGMVGTPSYMSPEQVKADLSAIGPATDIYSLGVILFEMLTGKTPYSGSMGMMMGQILAAPVPPVSEFRPDVDPRLDAICQKAMAKEPTDRFLSMAHLANALSQYCKAPTTSAARPPVLPTFSPLANPLPFDNLADETSPKQRLKTVRKKRRPVFLLPTIALALLLPLGVWLGVTLLRVETAEGTLIVELQDADVEARIKNGKLILAGPDGKDRYTLSPSERDKKIDAGPYKIRVEGGDGLVLDTTEFKLKKGGEVKVRVRMEPKVVATDPPNIVPLGKEITNSIGMKFVQIPAGTFSMGTPEAEKVRVGSERPEHDVRITATFHLGIYEVTQKQFEKVMGYNPSRFSRDGKGSDKDGVQPALAEFPVENVTWEEANEFCKKLSARQAEQEKRYSYRLPTEAEWEYACRGGTRSKTPYQFGTALSSTQANFGDSKLGRTVAVGSYTPNGFGLYDMHGNVWEWCSDRYDEKYYTHSPLSDPPGPSEGSWRVFRGGCWASPDVDCSAGARNAIEPGQHNGELGFRVALVPSPQTTASLDADRKAAEYVLSIGGTVRVNDQDRDIKTVEELPHGVFQITSIKLEKNNRITDDGFKVLRDCKAVKVLSLEGADINDSDLANL